MIPLGKANGIVLLRFGSCVFDDSARELRREGELAPLSPKAYQLLTLLLESRPRPLPQQDLKDALWPNSYVGYTSLAGLIAEIRKAVGDRTRPPQVIRTVPSFGYAFVAEVSVGGAARRGQDVGALVSPDQEFALVQGETLVGRGSECEVRLPSSQVSRVHARVRIEGKAVTVEDLGSKNGTWVNGVRKEGSVALTDGDEVIFGTFRVLYRGGVARSTRTGRPRERSRG